MFFVTIGNSYYTYTRVKIPVKSFISNSFKQPTEIYSITPLYKYSLETRKTLKWDALSSLRCHFSINYVRIIYSSTMKFILTTQIRPASRLICSMGPDWWFILFYDWESLEEKYTKFTAIKNALTAVSQCNVIKYLSNWWHENNFFME